MVNVSGTNEFTRAHRTLDNEKKKKEMVIKESFFFFKIGAASDSQFVLHFPYPKIILPSEQLLAYLMH